MIRLSVDTSFEHLAVCLTRNGLCLANYYSLCNRKNSSIIFGVIDELMKNAEVKLEDVDAAGVRIAVSARSAYDLWLERNIKNADLIRVEGIDASFDIFMEKELEALAGLRPRLKTDVERVPGAKILDGQFTAVQQAMGCTRG